MNDFGFFGFNLILNFGLMKNFMIRDIVIERSEADLYIFKLSLKLKFNQNSCLFIIICLSE